MKPTPGVWGLDLGQCALKAMRLQEIDGKLTATAFDYVEYPKILSQPDADPDQLTREALEQFLTRNTLRGDIVAIAVPGQSGLARFVKLPPVEEKKIADIVKFEAKQQIPFNLDEVVWDFQKIGSGMVVDGFALETEVGLFAMKRDMVNRYLGHFKEVKVEVHIIQMAPLALCNFVAFDLLGKDPTAEPPEGKQPCIVALDIGTDSSNLVITDGGRIIWQRPIPLGGNHFTRALTKEMKLTFAKAEHLKRNATKSGTVELKKILGTLKPVLNDFVGEVQRSLGYFTNTHRDAQIEYLVGLGNAFRLPGLQRFLAEKLSLEVRKLDKMIRLEGDSVTSAPIYHENILSFGVAYGLALQGMKRAKLVTNLLPGEIRMERLIRGKKPWAVAAAGVLLVGLGAAAMGNYFDQKPFTAAEVKTAITTSDAIAVRAKKNDDDFTTAKTNAIKEEDAVKAIIAGQFERLNWMHLTRFISDTVPRSDGSNLTLAARAKYFDKASAVAKPGVLVMSGKDAHKLLAERSKERDRSARDDEDDDLPPGIDDLIQYQIQSVDCRFCDDLSAYWVAATKDKDLGASILPVAHRDKKPEGKGWVIEVAGYTFHREKDAFIRETLLANIARMGAKTLSEQAAVPTDGKPPAPGTQPPPATTPAPADKKDEKPEDVTKQPVVDRVSHVFLSRSLSKTTSDTDRFEIISTSSLDALVGGSGGSAPGSGSPPGMDMGSGRGSGGGGAPPPSGGTGGTDAGPSRSSWRNISSRGGSGGVGGQGGMGAPPPGVVPGAGGMLGGRPGMQPPGVDFGGPPKDAKKDARPTHDRTEFIILFIWQEPTPSDALRAETTGK